MNDVKNFTPMDLALLRRVAAQGLSLDIMESIEDSHPLETAILSVMGIKGRGRPTYILRTNDVDYASQMRVEDAHVRITLLAPAPEADCSNYAWLALIDNMVRQAGRQGAPLITAEVPIQSAGFEIFRQCGFTVYSRESLYQFDHTAVANTTRTYNNRLFIRPIEENDNARLYALYTSTVPQLVQQVSPPPPNGWEGLALFLDNRLMGCLSIFSGKRSIVIQPYLHPELYDMVPDVLTQALPMLPERRIFLRLRAYQEWLRHALEIGFVEQTRYALMARHTVIRSEAVTTSTLPVLENMAFAANNMEVALEISSSEKPLES